MKCPKCNYVSIDTPEAFNFSADAIDSVNKINDKIRFLERVRFNLLKNKISISPKLLTQNYLGFLYKRDPRIAGAEIVGITEQISENEYKGVCLCGSNPGWEIQTQDKSEGYTIYYYALTLSDAIDRVCATDSFIPSVC